MLADVESPRAAGPRRAATTTDRLAGAGGVAFVVVLLIQNVVRAAGPSFDAGPAAVASYFAGHRVATLVPLGLFPVGMVAILSFAAGVRARTRESDERWWADLGSFGVVALAGLFSIVNIVEIVIAASGSDLAGVPELVRTLWTVHSAAFGLNLAAIAIALTGLSRAARLSGLIPRWLVILAVPGAVCLFAAAIGTVAIADGGHWIYLGYLGFAVWVVFLMGAGTALLSSRRSPRREATGELSV